MIQSSGWDIHDTVYSKELLISNRANGYRDLLAQVDLSTYRRIPWEFNVPFFLLSFLDPNTREPIAPCPRGTVKKALAAADEHGWECMSGVEYEVRDTAAHFIRDSLVLQYFQFQGSAASLLSSTS